MTRQMTSTQITEKVTTTYQFWRCHPSARVSPIYRFIYIHEKESQKMVQPCFQRHHYFQPKTERLTPNTY